MEAEVSEKSFKTNSTDWTICALCQIKDEKPIICPCTDSSYRHISENLHSFEEVGSIPLDIDLNRLDEGDGIQETFTKNNAKWHKHCYVKLSSYNLQRTKDRKRKHDEQSATPSSKNKTLTRLNTPSKKKQDKLRICFFCSNDDSSDQLHEVCTFQLDCNVRRCAHDLQDQELLKKLSGGDLIAQEAKYHKKCLLNLYNRCRPSQVRDSNNESEDTCHGTALAELVVYIQESREEDNIKYFKLAELKKLYVSRLDQLGVDTSNVQNSTRLKERLLVQLPGMMSYNKGRHVYLAFNDDVGDLVHTAFSADIDEQSVLMTKVARTLRKDMFSHKSSSPPCIDLKNQSDSVPQTLISLVNMIINGSNITEQSSDLSSSQAVMTISQLLMFNSIRRRKDLNNPRSIYHSIERETPLPLYIGLKMHSLTRKRKIVDSLYELGLSTSYNRVMDIESDMGNTICSYYKENNVVCPPQLVPGIFTTSAVDNIDHNMSSTTSSDSFHGTGISLFQNVTKENEDQINSHDVNCALRLGQEHGKVTDLPHDYTNITPTQLKDGTIYVPNCPGVVTPDCDSFEQQIQEDKAWLHHVNNIYNEEVTPETAITWAAFHASNLPEKRIVPSINAMLPLFSEEACSPAMVRHSLKVIGAAIKQIDPNQIPVVTMDQPLFALAKKLQWSLPEECGEDKYVLLLGGLHTEMTALKTLGNFLEGSGWVECLIEAGIASSGVADSFLKASHVTRTRYAHEVTVCALMNLLKKSYENYVTENIEDDQQLTMDEWCEKRKAETPQFHYWLTCLDIEMLVFNFVRSLRSGNFQMYINSISKLTPWFFSLNHTNYARWMPIHIRDMCSLQLSHPRVDEEFRKGQFVLQKSKRRFSSMAIDQGHEQNNATMKDDGGIVGITQDATALLRWSLTGPEIVRATNQFESSIGSKSNETSSKHHQETQAHQRKFSKGVRALTEVIETMGNPFEETMPDLIRLHNREVMDASSTNCLVQLHEQGQTQYRLFIEERLEENRKGITDPIPRNKVVLFNKVSKKKKSKKDQAAGLLKSEVNLFAQLFVACQARDGDLDSFFSHENHAFPPALSSYGEIRQGKKSDLMTCLEEGCQLQQPQNQPSTDVTILDGAAVINFLLPGSTKTFEDYASEIFLPYIKQHLQKACRVDIVWDQYTENSLKSQTRNNRVRENTQRRQIQPTSRIPQNWQQFLRVSYHKTELFSLLNNTLMAKPISEKKELVMTDGQGVICIPTRDAADLAPCNHEEADTRMMVHIKDSVSQGYDKILVRTVDTDVVVLAVATCQKLSISEIWVAFGTGKCQRYIAVHEIVKSLGPEKSLALPVFHAFTGCDTVSSFARIGKKSAWKIWEKNIDITRELCAVCNGPEVLTSHIMDTFERFTILMYDRTSMLTCIDSCRRELFTRKGRPMAALPPSRAALVQHVKRALLQGAHDWGSATETYRQMPSPLDWGWTEPENWQPLWTTLPPVNEACNALGRCKCKSSCASCLCVKRV